MNDVGQEVVVPEPVVDVHLVVVDRQGPIYDAPLLKSAADFEKNISLRIAIYRRPIVPIIIPLSLEPY